MFIVYIQRVVKEKAKIGQLRRSRYNKVYLISDSGLRMMLQIMMKIEIGFVPRPKLKNRIIGNALEL